MENKLHIVLKSLNENENLKNAMQEYKDFRDTFLIGLVIGEYKSIKLK